MALDKKTGIELKPEESPAWSRMMLGSRRICSYPGLWAIRSICPLVKGFLQVTPLAIMFAVPANGGYRVQPHLLRIMSSENLAEVLKSQT